MHNIGKKNYMWVYFSSSFPEDVTYKHQSFLCIFQIDSQVVIFGLFEGVHP
jgi:hypothetical protein